MDRRDLPAVAEHSRQRGDEEMEGVDAGVTHGAAELELLGIPASWASITPWPGGVRGAPGNRQLD